MLAFERHRANHPEDVPLLLVVSDGRANVAVGVGDPKSKLLALAGEVRARGIESVVVDTESGRCGSGCAARSARRWARPTCRSSSFGRVRLVAARPGSAWPGAS